MGLELMVYAPLVGWIVGIVLLVIGLAVALLSGPVLRLFRRLILGKAQSGASRPGRALTLLTWTGRLIGIAILIPGIFLSYILCPHIGPRWEVAEPGFNSQPDNAFLKKVAVDAVKPMAADKHVVGVAIGIIDGDTKAVYGFGQKSAVDSAPPDGDTVYEIGSVTKVFTSLLFSMLVDEGKLRLDEPLQEALGPKVVVPTYQGTPIRLVDLATHTAGLPGLPAESQTPMALWATLTPGNPYAYFPEERMLGALKTCPLASKPGTHNEYSNYGVMLLGNAVCRAAGSSYDELVRTRIAGPLGMANTAVTLSPEQARRRVPGYAGYFDAGSRRLSYAASPWDFPPGTEGAGALKSTVNDLLRFLSAQMQPSQDALGKAMENTQHPLRDTDDPDTRVGLGWHFRQTKDMAYPIVWHNGGTRGYSSFVAFCRERRTGVVLLSNSFETLGRIDVAGLGVFDALHNRPQAEASK
jgi:CubicO group peptidase (beta-lactamase class C family)